MGKRVLFLIVIAALMGSALSVNVGAQEDGRAAKIALVDRFTQELWIGWQYDIADEILTDDFVKKSWGMPDMDWETYLETTLKVIPVMFPDYSMLHHFALVDGDYVVVDDNWGGTFENEWSGLPPTGEQVRVNGVEVYHIEDGKIAEAWILHDTLSFMQQVGAVPAEGEITADEPWDIALGETSSTPEEHKALLAEVVQLVNDHDLDASYAHYTEDAVIHDQDGDLTKEEAHELMTTIQTAWPDHQLKDVSYFADGDLAVTPFTLVFAEDKVVFGGLNVYRFGASKIAEEWWLYDALSLMQQTAVQQTAPAETEPSNEFPTGDFVRDVPYLDQVYEGKLTLEADGTFYYRLDDVLYAYGTYSIDGNQFTWVTDTSCRQVPMTYTWSYENNVLTMYEVEFDPCPNRRQSIHGVPHEKSNE